jgi:hypothetical protein
MRQTAFLTFGVLILSTAAFAADPQLMNMVMPDAKILAGVNATNTRISPLGLFVISRVAMLGAEQKFIAATGFDPLQDVSEVLAATNADNSTANVKPASLLLVRGNFDVTKIVAAAGSGPKVQVTTYDGATLLSVTDAKTNETHALAFIGNSIAVAGELASVEAAVARNSAPGAAIDPALAAQVSQLSASEDEWLASSISVASLIPTDAPAPTGPAAQVLPILKNILSFSGGVNFNANVQVTGQAVASDAQNAAALGAVIKLATNLIGSVSTGKNPEVAQLVQWLQTLQVTTGGSDVNLTLSIPETQVEALLNEALKPAMPAAGARRRDLAR